MTDEAPTFTARTAAALCASHLLVDDPPPLCRDDFALALSGSSALGAALGDAGFRSELPTVWSWLGGTVYLEHGQVAATLRRAGRLSAPGSVLVADFVLARSLMDDVSRAADDIARPGAAREGGERYVTTFDTGQVADLVTACG